MATRSADFLEVEEYEAPNLHRSRSIGYSDFLEAQANSDRRDRERQMKRYYDSRYSSSQRQPSDRLYVPTFDTGHRRVRSYDEIIEKKEEPARTYNIREDKPKQSYEYDLEGEPARASQLPVPRRPRLLGKVPPVQIIQPDPPSQNPKDAAKRSPSASPRSPTARPQLQFQFATLQNKLAEIGTICTPYLDVEAANPRDLTFAKIAETATGYAFELRVFGHIVKLEKTDRIDREKRQIVEHAARTMDRMIDTVSRLSDCCSKARPKDLKVEQIPEDDDDDSDYGEYFEDDESGIDVIETLGFSIKLHLDSIKTQLQTLKRLSRSLQEATPAAHEEVTAVGALVEEVDKYFGSEGALRQNSTDPKFAGRKALEEARHSAGVHSR